MPDPLDPAVLEAQRKKRRELLESEGRESTNLTDGNDDVAAGSSYVADTLGS